MSSPYSRSIRVVTAPVNLITITKDQLKIDVICGGANIFVDNSSKHNIFLPVTEKLKHNRARRSRFGMTETGIFFTSFAQPSPKHPVTQRVSAHEERHPQSQEHRHQRPHRLGQDDPHREDPLLHRPHPRDARRQGQRRRGRVHGQHGTRARTGHHHRLGRHVLRVGRPRDQHHRHPRPRRLHHRGRALPAGARRRHPGAVRRRRRAVPVHHRRPADAALQGAVHRLREQVRPLRRQPLPGGGPAQAEARPQRRGHAAADRAGVRLHRRDRPS